MDDFFKFSPIGNRRVISRIADGDNGMDFKLIRYIQYLFEGFFERVFNAQLLGSQAVAGGGEVHYHTGISHILQVGGIRSTLTVGISGYHDGAHIGPGVTTNNDKYRGIYKSRVPVGGVVNS